MLTPRRSKKLSNTSNAMDSKPVVAAVEAVGRVAEADADAAIETESPRTLRVSTATSSQLESSPSGNSVNIVVDAADTRSAKRKAALRVNSRSKDKSLDTRTVVAAVEEEAAVAADLSKLKATTTSKQKTESTPAAAEGSDTVPKKADKVRILPPSRRESHKW